VGSYNRVNDNIGDRNVGDRNVGNDNRGNDNRGNGNVGDRNVGNRNVGNDNVGNDNVGDRNVGNGNIGNDNRGNENTGNGNVGDRNLGNNNRGNDNTGNGNVGDRNQGNGLRGNDQKQPLDLGLTWTGAGVGHDLANNYQRGIGTYNDAATRHDRAAARARAVGDTAGAAKHEKLAKHYRKVSAKLADITTRKLPKGVHGYIPKGFQQWSATTAADGINRRTVIGSNGQPARVMDDGLGWRVKETVRRGLTKVSGAGTIVGTAIDAGVANALIAQLLHAEADKPDQEINLYINCEGGDMTAMLAIYDTIQFIQSPVATFCVGQAISAGAVLLAAGTPERRAVLPHARVVLHQPAARGQGTIPDLILQADEVVRVRGQVEEILARHTGQSIERLHKDSDRDFIMSAAEAKEYGVIDEVLTNRELAAVATAAGVS
jgi:ATP-dependent Clp protease protease subunit